MTRKSLKDNLITIILIRFESSQITLGDGQGPRFRKCYIHPRGAGGPSANVQQSLPKRTPIKTLYGELGRMSFKFVPN